MHRCRRWPIGLLLVLLVGTAPPQAANGATGGGSDPDDGANLRLDIRAATHSDDSTSITYTVETYRGFPDSDVDLRWSLDLNGDGRSDLGVATQWEEDKRILVATVEDARERVVARATVTRPAPDAIRVSFPRALLGAISSYRYSVIGVTDLDHDGETSAGERDIAPNDGFYEHRLGSGTPPDGDPPPGTSGPPATMAPVISPPTGSHPPTQATNPGPTNSHGTAGAPPRATPNPSNPSISKATATPRGNPTAAGTSASAPPPAGVGPHAANPPVTSIPTTGFPDGDLAGSGAALLLVGLTCQLIGRKRTLTRRGLPRCGEHNLRC